MYDTIIIGSGPAGFTAGIYAARREMKTLIIGKELGGQLIWASEIENYPGFKSIEAFELILKMQAQVKNLGVEIKQDEVKEIIKKEEGTFVLTTEKEKFEARTIIIAMGLSPRRLEIKGEKEFSGKGVSYCANCDGPLYKDKTVAVVGAGNSAFDAAEILSKISKKVYLIHRTQKFRAFKVLVDKVKAKENVAMVLDSVIEEISGENNVNKIKVKNIQKNETREIAVDGVFIEVGRIASTDLVGGLVKRNEKNQILVDENCKTSCDGMYAAGDVTQIPFKQITIACGQGTIAALAAYQYLQLKEGKSAVVMDRSVHK